MGLRILHLAYEDPQQPGSGGGAVRTLEVNKRLAKNHDITALVSGYPGAKERYEDGIHWVPIGTRWRYSVNKLTYFALLNVMMQRYKADVVVEDFGAPISTAFTPLFTRRPVVASVQWLFANEMRAKYHLPVDWIEQAGLRFYDDFITVSSWLAQTIKDRHPRSIYTEAIPNGIEPVAFTVTSAAPQYLLFVGRLDVAQKGCDLLIPALAQAKDALGDAMPDVLFIGDGPDKVQIETLVADYALGSTVKFCGRVNGLEKYQMMANAHAVLMSSRFETFGMVAVEAQAAGAPVIAFDAGPLREVAGGGGARLVKAFDVAAFAAEIVALVEDNTNNARLREQGRQWAMRYNWDTIASQQEAHYWRSIERHRTSST